jgi:hypothetical protein
MKTKILLLSLMTSLCCKMHGQNRTRVNAMNDELDNLDLRAVTDILGTLEIFRILKDV